MRLTKIYTKIGDKGTTVLADGSTVPKDSQRVEAYGSIDELNSFLGWLRDALASANSSQFSDLTSNLSKIQNEMHDLGSEIATPFDRLQLGRQQLVTHACIERLETEIDAFNTNLQPLANFVLPGGHQANSIAHVCRTVCRRTERQLAKLARSEAVREEPQIYLNRLSDWLFVASRVISQRLGVPEVLWQQAGKQPNK